MAHESPPRRNAIRPAPAGDFWERTGEGVLDRAVMRVAALDYGKTRVGVAISDELGLMAHPRKPIDAQNRKSLLSAIAELAKEDQVELFVVGVPLDKNGEAGIEARRAEHFAEQVAETTGCDVQLWDERLTTVEAARRLREGGTRARDARSRIDGAAACVMLQAYLDAHGGDKP